MTKAQDTPTTATKSLTRRAALAGAACLPALAVPVLAVPAIASDHPDAELIELGKHYDKLVQIYEDAQRRSTPNWNATESALAAMVKGPHTNEEIMSCLERVDRDFPIASPTCDDVTDAMNVPACRIIALPATTLAGLAVKARLAKFTSLEKWKASDEDAEWDDLIFRNAIDATLQLAVQS